MYVVWILSEIMCVVEKKVSNICRLNQSSAPDRANPRRPFAPSRSIWDERRCSSCWGGVCFEDVKSRPRGQVSLHSIHLLLLNKYWFIQDSTISDQSPIVSTRQVPISYIKTRSRLGGTWSMVPTIPYMPFDPPCNVYTLARTLPKLEISMRLIWLWSDLCKGRGDIF